MTQNLPPGEYDISYEYLKKLGGVPTLPKRPYIRKIRHNDPHWLSSDFMMFIAYPWILSDERNGVDLCAFRTWEAAYARACEMITAVPQGFISFNSLSPDRRRFTDGNIYRLFGERSVTMSPNACVCGHVAMMHDYASEGLYRDGCAVCDCKKTRGYVQYTIDKRT